MNTFIMIRTSFSFMIALTVLFSDGFLFFVGTTDNCYPQPSGWKQGIPIVQLIIFLYEYMVFLGF